MNSLKKLIAFAIALLGIAFSPTVAASVEQQETSSWPFPGVGGGRVIFHHQSAVDSFSVPFEVCPTMAVRVGAASGGIVSLYAVDAEDVTVGAMRAHLKLATLSDSLTYFEFRPKLEKLRLVLDVAPNRGKELDLVLFCGSWSRAQFLNGFVIVEEVAGAGTDEPIGQWVFCTAACTRSLPKIEETGDDICFYTLEAAVLVISPDDEDAIRLDGNLEAAGKDLISSGLAGEFLCVVSRENGGADEWVALPGNLRNFTIEP